MKQRWLERRQAALEPAYRRSLGLQGEGQTTTQARIANQARLQRGLNMNQTFQTYMTNVERTIHGPRHAVSLVSYRPNLWTTQSASFENSFFPHKIYPSQPDHEVRIIADRNFDQNGIGIPNSEVLFLQYQAVGFQQRAHSLKRQHITNAETRQVTALSFQHKGIDPTKSDRKIEYRYEGRDAYFYALLGTPNGRAGAYLVIDHGEELGIIGISRIEHHCSNDEEHMYLTFTPDELR